MSGKLVHFYFGRATSHIKLCAWSVAAKAQRIVEKLTTYHNCTPPPVPFSTTCFVFLCLCGLFLCSDYSSISVLSVYLSISYFFFFYSFLHSNRLFISSLTRETAFFCCCFSSVSPSVLCTLCLLISSSLCTCCSTFLGWSGYAHRSS